MTVPIKVGDGAVVGFVVGEDDGDQDGRFVGCNDGDKDGVIDG